jgi:hypothetical protein
MTETPQTEIEIELGFKATRKFSSTHFSLSIRDHRREGETLDEAVERVYSYVEGKTIEKLDRVKEELAEVYDGKKRQGTK